MKQREVYDGEKTWQCVQAFAGVNVETAAQASERVSPDGGVTVVCTPSGGEQTVRIKATPDWLEAMDDDELIRAINEERNSTSKTK